MLDSEDTRIQWNLEDLCQEISEQAKEEKLSTFSLVSPLDTEKKNKKKMNRLRRKSRRDQSQPRAT